VLRYSVENFGCRATQADGAALERQFAEQGLTRAATSAQAEVVILNTCTVTASADQDARAAIRRIQRQNPTAKIVVTGCYAQRAPEEVAALPGVSLVVGNSHKHQLAELALHGALSGSVGFVPLDQLAVDRRRPTTDGERPIYDQSPIFVSDIFAHTELLAAPVFDSSLDECERTRPNLKVQDGCDNRCSFCVIPYVRGQSRSLPLDRILEEVNALVAAGYREVVVSGINLGRWGRDLTAALQPASGIQEASGWSSLESRKPGTGSRKPRFEDLIRAVLSQTTLEKLRISSVEPMDWTDELIALVANSPRIAKHAHMPMQSGSDAVLRRMHRKYRPWHYREKIEKIRAAMPEAAIGADVMVGFPGETDAEFEATRSMIEDLPFTYLHVFTYSARPGTPAAAMRNQVPVHVARERNRVLRELAAEKKQGFMRSFVGRSLEAITLGRVEEATQSADAPATRSAQMQACEAGDGIPGFAIGEAFTEALADNYLKLHLQGRHEPNRWMRVHVEDVCDGFLVGRVIEDAKASPPSSAPRYSAHQSQ
jgi:threonylcarbamoyladenosine tRNA methylthiotransferase MtaB